MEAGDRLNGPGAGWGRFLLRLGAGYRWWVRAHWASYGRPGDARAWLAGLAVGTVFLLLAGWITG